MTAGPGSLHIVCPHCDSVNRIQTARIDHGRETVRQAGAMQRAQQLVQWVRANTG